MGRVKDDYDTDSFRHLEKVLPHADFVSKSDYIGRRQEKVEIPNLITMYDILWARKGLHKKPWQDALSSAKAQLTSNK